MGFKLWTICTSSGYLFDLEPSVMGRAGLTLRRSLLLLCESLKHSNYCLWGDNLFVSMATIAACYQIPQKIFPSGTPRRDAAGSLAY